MERTIVVGDAHLAVEDRGEGPAVLLVHGFPFDRSLWRRQTAALAHCRRVAPDLRGLGQSELGTGRVTVARYAHDLVLLLDALGIETAVVCGLSMGGYVALELAYRHSERLRGLVLMDTRAEADSVDGRRGRDEMAALALSEGMRAIAERMVPRLLAPRTARRRPGAVRHLEEMILRAPPQGVVAALHAMRDRSPATAWLPYIRVPTLVVAGAEDQLTPPEAAEAMAARIPGARVAIVSGAGHLPPIERPQVTSQLLRGFVHDLG